eukprot:5155211-Pyramimonas_sp.AAC.1
MQTAPGTRGRPPTAGGALPGVPRAQRARVALAAVDLLSPGRSPPPSSSSPSSHALSARISSRRGGA